MCQSGIFFSTNVMKHQLLAGLAISLGLSAPVLAQAPTQTTSNGVVSRAAQQGATTSSTSGLQRKGSGKMSSGVSRNGNSNLSPTSPTNTQGSTSEGSASRASTGGAPGTNTKEARLPRPGTAGDTRPTRSAQGAKAGSATSAGLTGSRPNDALNNTSTPPKMSTTATKNSSRNTQNSQASTVSTSGKTGSRRPSSQAQVQKEAKTPDEMSATGYPSGANKSVKGKTGKSNANIAAPASKTGN